MWSTTVVTRPRPRWSHVHHHSSGTPPTVCFRTPYSYFISNCNRIVAVHPINHHHMDMKQHYDRLCWMYLENSNFRSIHPKLANFLVRLRLWRYFSAVLNMKQSGKMSSASDKRHSCSTIHPNHTRATVPIEFQTICFVFESLTETNVHIATPPFSLCFIDLRKENRQFNDNLEVCAANSSTTTTTHHDIDHRVLAT